MAVANVMDDVEFRSVAIADLEARLDNSEEGTFAGYACRFGVIDSYGTTFVSGCWSSGGLDGGTYALLSMHDETRVVGAFTATEDEIGLFIRGRYDDTPEGHAARARARSGSAPELSVGFLRTGVDPADSDLITGARLYEVSQITARMASQPMAALTMVRSAVDNRVDGDGDKDRLQPESVVDTPTGEVDTKTETEAPAVENSGEEERAGKPTCRACGKGVRKFICSGCLQSGIKGGNVSSEERMDLPHEIRAYTNVAGSYEDRIESLRAILVSWATRAYGMDANDLYVSIQATFSDSVVFRVESWDENASDDLVKGVTWRVAYVINDGDGITLGEPSPAELVTVVRDHVPALEVRSEEGGDGETVDGEGQENTEASATTEEPQVAEETTDTTDEQTGGDADVADAGNGRSDADATDDTNGNAGTDADVDQPTDEERRKRVALKLRLLSAAS